MNFPFIKYSKIWVVLSVTIAILSATALFIWGLKFGIDFTGGSLMELKFTKVRPAVSDLAGVLEKNDFGNSIIQKTGDDSFIIRTASMSEDTHQKTLGVIKQEFGSEGNQVIETSFEMIGPSVSSQLRQRSIWAIVLVNLGILIYIGYAFRKVSRPIASWKYGLLAIIAMLHDVLLVVGVFAVLGHFFGVEIDVSFVVALLTVLGFSVHDTIVVYDRMRERLLRRTTETFEELVNAGLNQTLMRSLNTTLTTVLTLLALFFFGGLSIHYFVLALLIGFTTGAYSSIFIASPLLVYVERWQRKKA